jgi:hypothetical protein
MIWGKAASRAVLRALFWALVLLLMAMAVARFGRRWEVRDERGAGSDGRYHTCGLVTDDGVTEHLQAYWGRCGKPVDGHSGGDAGH